MLPAVDLVELLKLLRELWELLELLELHWLEVSNSPHSQMWTRCSSSQCSRLQRSKCSGVSKTTQSQLCVCVCLVRMCMHTHAQYFGFLRENSSACFCAAVAITYLLYRLSFWICLAEGRGQISALCWLFNLSVDLPLWSPMVYNVNGSGRRINLSVSTRVDTLTCTRRKQASTPETSGY